MMPERSHNAKANVEQIEFLYKKYYQQLYVFANGFLGDEEESRDTVNDVFEQIWKNKSSEGHDEKSFCVYAYKLIRSRCLDRLRHQLVERRYEQLSSATDFIQSEEDVRDFEQRIEHLRKAIDKLPEPGQSIIKTYYYKRLTYQQVADELNLSIHTVHKTMTRMYAKLREMLKNDK